MAVMWHEESKIKHGAIIAKYHDEAHTTTMMMPVGKVMVPQTQYHPESWSILIRRDGQEATRYVRKEVWEQLMVGDYFPPGG